MNGMMSSLQAVTAKTVSYSPVGTSQRPICSPPAQSWRRQLAKTIEVVRLNTKLDMHFFNSNFYYNAQIGAKYFPAGDGKTNINAMASIGSAPETAVLDYALPGSFSHTNTMVGLGGQYMISPNITIGLMGTWNTYYNQTNTVKGTTQFDRIETVSTRYKNLYNIYAQIYISF